MSGLQRLAACVGSWRGNNRLQDPHTNAPDDSPATANVVSVCGGRFLRLDYTWTYRGEPQEGSLLVGWEAKTLVATAHWIDSWHMSDKVMACSGTADPAGALDVHGSYAAPPGPDWGWRIAINPGDGSRLRMVMHNIWPDGREGLAVEAEYYRES